MSPFTFETARKVVCEDGAARRLGEIAAGLGVTRVLVVTDKPLFAAGLLKAPLESFAAARVESEVFSDVLADPPEAAVEAALAAARAFGADGVVGFGGGSSMDTAKLVALLAASGQALQEVYGVDKAAGARLPLIQVPTTAGTGSEVTAIAVVTTPTHEKVGVVTPLLYPDVALLDAELTLGLPPRVTAMTGVDAMVHAIESYTGKLKKNPVSDALALKALELLSANILTAVQNGGDLDARRAMLQGAMLAGVAFANSPVGAVHALAYPLGGHFHVPHGLSNALVLGPVLKFNLAEAEGLYGELARAMPPWLTAGRPGGAGFVAACDQLVAAMPMEQRLREVGVDANDIERLADDAMKVQRLLVNNPREIAHADAVAIYRDAF
jgi:alcohol dehydrogenase class IV